MRNDTGADPARQLDQGLQDLGLKLPVMATDQLLELLRQLTRWNRSYNLTAVSEPNAMVQRHLLDSLSILPWIDPWIDRGPLLDIGSGGGFPGLPLAICRPDLDVTLLDSNGKKLRFLRHAARHLGLDNVQIVQARAGDYRPQTPPAIITARALAALPDLYDWCRDLIHSGSRLLAMKGQRPSEEIAALPADCPSPQVVPIEVPGLSAARHLVIISAPHRESAALDP